MIECRGRIPYNPSLFIYLGLPIILFDIGANPYRNKKRGV
jgi:hypothetical protein